MPISERVEDVTGESPGWWALELYKVAFLLVGGMYLGWTWSNHVTSTAPTALVIEGSYTPEPPLWMPLLLVPGVLYLLWVVFPWPWGGAGAVDVTLVEALLSAATMFFAIGGWLLYFRERERSRDYATDLAQSQTFYRP